MIMVEVMIDKIVCVIGSDFLLVRKCNLYGFMIGSLIFYGMKVEYNFLFDMIVELEEIV